MVKLCKVWTWKSDKNTKRYTVRHNTDFSSFSFIASCSAAFPIKWFVSGYSKITRKYKSRLLWDSSCHFGTQEALAALAIMQKLLATLYIVSKVVFTCVVSKNGLSQRDAVALRTILALSNSLLAVSVEHIEKVLLLVSHEKSLFVNEKARVVSLRSIDQKFKHGGQMSDCHHSDLFYFLSA